MEKESRAARCASTQRRRGHAADPGSEEEEEGKRERTRAYRIGERH